MTDAAYPAAVLVGQPDPRIRANILTVLLTSVAYFMAALDTLVVVTALPSIHRDLGGNVGTLQWAVNAYVLAFGAGIITAAAIGDLIGRRRMYVLGLAIFTAASAGCALAPGIGARPGGGERSYDRAAGAIYAYSFIWTNLDVTAPYQAVAVEHW